MSLALLKPSTWWMLGGAAILLLSSHTAVWVWTKLSVEAKWKAREYAAEKLSEATEKNWSTYATVAKEKYDADKKLSITGAVERERLRKSASVGLPGGPASSNSLCTASPATRAELLQFGEAVVGLAEQAAESQRALRLCVNAWPR